MIYQIRPLPPGVSGFFVPTIYDANQNPTRSSLAKAGYGVTFCWRPDPYPPIWRSPLPSKGRWQFNNGVHRCYFKKCAPMASDALALAGAAEKLGIVGFLVAFLFLAGWVIRHLYKEKSEGDAARIKLTADIGEVKGDVKAMSAKLEAEQDARASHTKDMELLHRSMLEAVARRD